ncbi:MAG TPA: glycosyltransferase family 2 protein [Thermoanaerobaculia bacterium]|nr:glycosyltransferase family 2 protein [Thermoanaerobaculia bacterium]
MVAARAEPKSSAMYVSIVLFYLACAATLNPRLLHLFTASAGVTGNLLVALFILQLNIFWIFGGYYFLLGVFTPIDRMLRPPRPSARRCGPAVAMLYTTMNDFQEDAALSCLEQDYTSAHLFILDDSVDIESRAAIDAFGARHAGSVTVVRREDRHGFKAGSINSALRKHVRDFPYFLVADADSVLPRDFVSSLIPYFDLGDDIAWVQGSHAPNPAQKSPCARDMALGILPLWEIYYGPRNRFGNVVFMGHGGIIRYDVWQEAGGFPEIVSEDLAFSTRAGVLGYRGYFAHDVVSFEDFPIGYRQLRRQQARYVKGVCEYLHRESGRYLRARNVHWFEKLDVVLSCGTLFLPALVLCFMITFCLLVPLRFGIWAEMTLQIAGRDVSTIPALLLGGGFPELWNWPYFAVTALCTLAPVLGCFSVMARYPIRGTKMFLMSGVPYMSLLVMITASIVSYLLSHRAVFLVTGDRWGVDPRSYPRGFSPAMHIVERIGAEDSITRIAELVLGIAFTALCILTVNVSLMSFGLALVLGPLLSRVRWEAPLIRPLLFMPFVFVCAGLLLGGMNVASAQGVTMSVLFFHF